MSLPDVSGFWTGEIFGTNHGGLILDIKQTGARITGTAKMHEPALGQYEYTIEGQVTDNLAFKLTPGRRTGGLNLGMVQAVCQLLPDGSITGRWKSDIGTEGAFNAKRFDPGAINTELPKANSVFLVHGHDEGAKHAVARFLEQLGITPVILQEQVNRGMTVIEKFEEFASRAGFAVVLMTPDDIGYAANHEGDKKPRPRQNVILELGYFAAKLGRRRTLVITKGELEMPSDVFGLLYEPMDSSHGWKMVLAQELKSAGFTIDLNRALN
ncbi:TIR domain-containing protein [Opitutus terrae]|uniref:Nucleotide-binding protein containing TIR-like protein domain-like protein n=1 Tax=Opitutus terrae (strain DSM 11246 / JCM 15787 / PB90-1) TaxID=452637 RepID=B1ZZI8_OPITP|nr:nucleotide-binding protein [Opitutus terrae]ACB76391.1 nucleotide-binding protein containing TIR -like protein domain-like protein [Opitutus terrae PB90-1]